MNNMKGFSLFAVLLLVIGFTGCKPKPNRMQDNSYLSSLPVIEEIDFSEIYLPVEKESDTQKATSKERTWATITVPETEWDQFDFIKQLDVRELPYMENTDFDDYNFYNILTPAQRKLLKLDDLLEGIEEINLSNRLWYSDQFLSLVINYFHGDHELFTQLINYDKDLNIIANRLIAYDEIAESATRIESHMRTDGFLMIHTSSWDEEPTITETIHKIRENGTIEAEE